MSDLNFDGMVFNVVTHNKQPCLTLSEIAEALYGRADAKGVTDLSPPYEGHIRSVHRLYRLHADEFSDSMTAVVKLYTAGGAQDVRVFSLRGAHLLGMLARGKRAKEFRRWVLDILDQHAADANTLLSQYHQAVAMLTAEQEVASWHGHGLRVWQRKKAPMVSRAKQLHDELQLKLPGVN
ncbi:ORF11CD3 domain-containing protein [Paraburkholderia sp. BL8N3]|nr:transcriptional regulator [Paraburkholderia sp. BL8N3]TCK36695.1 ORF11CD3 domain-containing protein [Paraburkholderia sp. BL8N3]